MIWSVFLRCLFWALEYVLSQCFIFAVNNLLIFGFCGSPPWIITQNTCRSSWWEKFPIQISLNISPSIATSLCVKAPWIYGARLSLSPFQLPAAAHFLRNSLPSVPPLLLYILRVTSSSPSVNDFLLHQHAFQKRHVALLSSPSFPPTIYKKIVFQTVHDYLINVNNFRNLFQSTARFFPFLLRILFLQLCREFKIMSIDTISSYTQGNGRTRNVVTRVENKVKQHRYENYIKDRGTKERKIINTQKIY